MVRPYAVYWLASVYFYMVKYTLGAARSPRNVLQGSDIHSDGGRAAFAKCVFMSAGRIKEGGKERQEGGRKKQETCQWQEQCENLTELTYFFNKWVSRSHKNGCSYKNECFRV